MSTTILALIHHEIISEKFVVFNLELFRSTASMTMNLKKKKHLEMKMLISLNQHLPEVSARQHTSCLDQQLDHDSDRFLEMPGCSLDVS